MNALEIKQGSLVTPKEIIKLDRLTASPGQMFWVTCPVYLRAKNGFIRVARSNQNAGSAKAISFEDFQSFFVPVSTF